MALLVLDIATAPIPNAGDYIETDAKAPANWVDPEKIAAYQARKVRSAGADAALDFDLARVTGVGTLTPPQSIPDIALLHDEREERDCIEELAKRLKKDEGTVLVTFNGLAFDLPMLMRRADYLGIDFPRFIPDPWKSPHIDVCMALRFQRPQIFRSHGLQFYIKRLGWTDLEKPLKGDEEAQVPVTGRWGELQTSIHHDVIGCYRLGLWLCLYNPVSVAQGEPIL